MQKRKIGRFEVAPIGLGCMGFTQSYPPFLERRQSIENIRAAVDLGYTLFDTAEVYGPYDNESLVGEALENIRDEVVIETKFGFNLRRPKDGKRLSSKKEDIIAAVEGSLKRLKTDRIDVLYQHRVDPDVPIEEVADTVSKLMKEGKVLEWGLSEANAENIRKANAVCPLSALQSEYSMFFRDHEKDVMDTVEELGLTYVAFSPLGRQMLTGTLKKGDEFKGADFRADTPRFQGENFEHNLALSEYVKELAKEKGCAPSKIALSWILHQKPFIIPIPGTKSPERMKENLDSQDITFTEDELKNINEKLSSFEILGNRYSPANDVLVDR